MSSIMIAVTWTGLTVSNLSQTFWAVQNAVQTHLLYLKMKDDALHDFLNGYPSSSPNSFSHE